MTFASILFLFILLPLLLICCFVLTRIHDKQKLKHGKLGLILAANLFFYMWAGFGALFITLIYCVAAFLLCRLVYAYKRKLMLTAAAVVLLLPLLFLKYTDFLIDTINQLFGTGMPELGLLLPLGVSFYTFQALSLIVDTYRGRVEEKTSLLYAVCYLMFMPTVTSGPITRFDVFQTGLSSEITYSDLSEGIQRFVVGLAKKTLIAEKLLPLADYFFNGVAAGGSFSIGGRWIGSVAYTLQLYFDFSGYSDMAIGLGRMLGFRLPENFDAPYHSKSIREFWRRWHITLGAWFRDYVYIPMGGSRCSGARELWNLGLVWFLTGFWHGANWTFLIWGGAYFLLLVLEKRVGLAKKLGRVKLNTVYTLFCVNLLWVLFRSADVCSAGSYLGGMFGFNGHAALPLEEKALRFLPFLAFAALLCLPWKKWFGRYTGKRGFHVVKGITLCVLMFLCVCAVMNSTYTPFIYGQF